MADSTTPDPQDVLSWHEEAEGLYASSGQRLVDLHHPDLERLLELDGQLRYAAPELARALLARDDQQRQETRALRALAEELHRLLVHHCELAAVHGEVARELWPLLAAALGMSVDDLNATMPAWGGNRGLEAQDYAKLAGELLEGARDLDPEIARSEVERIAARLGMRVEFIPAAQAGRQP